MKVVLLQDVKKMGKKGDVIEVADAYGRNVLIRKGLGVEGTMASQLKAVKVVIKVQSGEDGRIFGSVTGKDISEALEKQYKFKLEKKNIRLKAPIKTVGEYDVEVWVHQQVTSTVHVSVVTE